MNRSTDNQNQWKEICKKKLKQAWERLEEAKEWAVKNQKQSISALAVILVVLVLTISVIAGQNKKQETAGAGTVTGTELGSIPVPAVPLEENAHAEVNELIGAYYKALADGNLDELSKLKNNIDDTEKIRIEKKSKYIESYDNIVCYTKVGLTEGSYLVYAYYEAKFYDIETKAPALNTFVVYKNESGQYYIYEGDLDDNVSNYLQELSSQDDVTNLCNTVQAKYNEAIASDDKLKEFMEQFPDVIKKEVGEALAALEAGEETEETEEPASEETEEEKAAVEIKEVETTDTVNVRSSDSETADNLGKVDKGTRLALLEKKENGWTKVTYNDGEGYIKSEFLADVAVPENAEEAAPAEEQKPEEKPAEQESKPEKTGKIGKDGKVTATTTVNVRASASETGERLGTIYMGEKLELVMEQADGWCKVKYNGKTGYVKTEFVE